VTSISLRLRLSLYLIALHLIFFAFSFVLYSSTPILFATVEVLLVTSMAGGFHLIRRALEPLSYTRRFHDLLQDQSYAIRLKQTPDRELGELVDLFNSMLGALYQERHKLGEQQGFLDRLLEATPSAVLVFDFDARITLMNASASKLLGLDNASGRPLSDWQDVDVPLASGLDAGARTRCRSLINQLDTLPLGESRMISDHDGRRYRAQRGHFFDRGFARHFLLIEELTEELESSERTTYEKLIRVLAHEVNNTVAATGSVLDSLLFYNTQLALRDRGDFCTAIDAVKRRNSSLGEFIERFTRVVKMPAPELRPVAIAPMMEDIMWLYREQCKSRSISLTWGDCDEVPPLAMDGQLIEQALVNIVKNAMEAAETTMCEEKADVGYVRIALTREHGGARLSIVDSGNRLGEIPVSELFTPFFTTKKDGQGIGLMFVREVLNRHGFTYRFVATDTNETRFDIWFPSSAYSNRASHDGSIAHK
jgi:two-component system nitrogen regulation sensor histidine kinase NtrY